MNGVQHTQGPLIVKEQAGEVQLWQHLLIGRTLESSCVAVINGKPDEQARADAQRIAMCWNTHDQIKTQATERRVLAQSRIDQQDLQIAALGTALRWALVRISASLGEGDYFDAAETILDRVAGTSPHQVTLDGLRVALAALKTPTSISGSRVGRTAFAARRASV